MPVHREYERTALDCHHPVGHVFVTCRVEDLHDVGTRSHSAIAWLLSRDAVTSVLIGATKLHQLEDTLGAADLILTREEIAELDDATPLPPVYPNWLTGKLRDAPAVEVLERLH